MAHYKKKDWEQLSETTKIPKELVDAPLVIAEKQSRKLWTRALIVDSKKPVILECLRQFHDKNRIHELLVMIEEVNSLYGSSIVSLEKYPGQIPLINIADPYMLSSVGKFLFTEKTATIYKYIVKDTKTYPVLEVWTDKTVKRTWYLPNKAIDTGQGVTLDIKELKDVDIMQVEEKPHGLGCLPIVELKNKQKWIPPLMEPWSWKPELATWYPVRGLIQFYYHSLRQIWKNMILVKPKIFRNYSPQDLARLLSNPGEMQELYADFLINLDTGGDPGKPSSSRPEIIQGEMRLKEWMEGLQAQWNTILLHVGITPDTETEAVQTATGVKAREKSTGETIDLLRQLRIDQWLRIHDKVLIIEKLWDGKGDRPYTLSIAEEEKSDQSLQTQEAVAKMEANLSNPILEIAKMYGVTKHEAENILHENIKVRSEVFEKTKHMNESGEGDNKDKPSKKDK